MQFSAQMNLAVLLVCFLVLIGLSTSTDDSLLRINRCEEDLVRFRPRYSRKAGKICTRLEKSGELTYFESSRELSLQRIPSVKNVNLEFGLEANWMSELGDEISLLDLSIPGTHDSAATVANMFTQCQSNDIMNQLLFGVRFLDLRVKEVKGSLHLYHGPVSQKQSLESALNQIKDFLHSHSKEALIVSLKPEGSFNPTSFQSSLLSLLQKFEKIYYKGSDIPTIGTVRGKIVWLFRFRNTLGFGVNLISWNDNGNTFECSGFSSCYSIQDKYNAGGVFKKSLRLRQKWNLVKNHLDSAKDDKDGHLYLNFASGYLTRGGAPLISKVSNYNNDRLLWELEMLHEKRKTGIIIIDFITRRLSFVILRQNFHFKDTKFHSWRKPGIYLYQHSFFEGRHIYLANNDEILNLKSEDFNDRTSSVLIIGSMQVTLFRHWRKTGLPLTLDTSVVDLKEFNFGDRCSSVQSADLADGVYFYEHSYFRGELLRKISGNLIDFNWLEKRKVFSVRISGPFSVSLHSEIGLQGNQKILNSSVSYLYDFTYRISSFKVKRLT